MKVRKNNSRFMSLTLYLSAGFEEAKNTLDASDSWFQWKEEKKDMFFYLASRPSWGYRLVNSYDLRFWPTLLSLYWWLFHHCSWFSKLKSLPLWIFDWWWSNRHNLYDDRLRLLCSWAECWLQQHWKKRRLRTSLVVNKAFKRWTFVLHEWKLLNHYLDRSRSSFLRERSW